MATVGQLEMLNRLTGAREIAASAAAWWEDHRAGIVAGTDRITREPGVFMTPEDAAAYCDAELVKIRASLAMANTKIAAEMLAAHSHGTPT